MYFQPLPDQLADIGRLLVPCPPRVAQLKSIVSTTFFNHGKFSFRDISIYRYLNIRQADNFLSSYQS